MCDSAVHKQRTFLVPEFTAQHKQAYRLMPLLIRPNI